MKHYKTLKTQTTLLTLLFLISVIIVFGLKPVTIVLVVGTLTVMGFIWRLFRALQRQIGDQQFQNFRQLETLSGLYNTLDIQHPLPLTRHTAASPDFLHLLANEIFRLRPLLIVEVGSGTSTLVAAYCLKKIGQGKIISLDHLEKYASITQQTIKSHDLDNFAEVVYSPLKTYEKDGASLLWYDDSVLKPVDSIDLLIVDGPPKGVSELARYPALPLLKDKLHEGSIVLLDDGARVEETKTVALWEKELGLTSSFHSMEKGAFLCYFRKKQDGA
ncbi:MAG: putative O-methyltransferase YrrM [Gammaproteobacteria bacterium]|jgi:predicted O-methyltransferase YrrM